MLLAVILTIISGNLVAQFVDGNPRVVFVVSDESTSDNKNFFASGSGDNNLMCCIYGNCSCNSLDYALANLTSNFLINVMTDVLLSLLVNASNLENVSIIGHNNPTVNCTSAGGLHFNFCHNCIIQGITWDGCGTETKPGIKLNNSSDIAIESCYFQYSKGPAVVLSGASGHVNISHCNFAHNYNYGGHGTAIHYSSSNHVTNDLQLFLTISNCSFTSNKHAKSLVYIENIKSKYNDNITFQNIKVCHNQGVSIYVVNQNIYLLGKILFRNNTAENGAGIFMKDYSTIIFGKHSDVAFIQNSAYSRGGAVFLRNHSNIIFDQNSVSTFNGNDATGGTIYSEVSSNVTFQANCEVTFGSNSVKCCGSAIYTSDSGHVTFTGNSKVSLTNNEVYRYYYGIADNGGTIYSKHSHVSFEGNSITLFRDNIAYSGPGGAIFSEDSTTSFKENSTTEFINNTAVYGGAIECYRCSMSFEENSNTKFSNSNAIQGGVMYCWYSSVSFEENSVTEFTSNTAREYGGAIISVNSSISFEENSTTEFTNNIANSYDGGAIYSRSGSIYFKENSNTRFTNNAARENGGAIISLSSSISFEENSTTEFTNNIAYSYDGGAIYSRDGFIFFDENSNTQFTNNTAPRYFGGAIYSTNSSTFFKENSTAQFASNIASYGGALYLKDGIISFKENCSAQFTNNIAKNGGGAIDSLNSPIYFEGNSITEFISNTASENGGAIYCQNSPISFENISNTRFNNNVAEGDGGAIYAVHMPVSFQGNSHIEFNSNVASIGGAVYSINNSISFGGFSATVFSNNIAKDYGGTIAAKDKSGIIFCNNSTIIFTHNKAPTGEAVYCGSNSNVTTKGNPTVMFNDVLPKWCTNICIPNTGQGAVTIDSNGRVMCSDHEAFMCLTENCNCKSLEHLLRGLRRHTSNVIVNLTDRAILSSLVGLTFLKNVSIIGQDNFTVLCTNSGALDLASCQDVTIRGITWIGCGGYNVLPMPVIWNYHSSLLIQKCTFQFSKGPVLYFLNPLRFIIDHCNFINSQYYRGHGAAIFLTKLSLLGAHVISNCDFSNNEGVKSIVYLEDTDYVLFYYKNTTFYNNQGVSIYLSPYCFLHISGDILFNKNTAENGAGIYISDHSAVIFGENSDVKFINSSVDHNGSAIFVNSHSNVTFEQNSVVIFDENKGISGTIYSEGNSNIIFRATSQVIFNNNSATQYGAAIYSFDNSHVTFTGSSKVTFSNNVVSNYEGSRDMKFGGVIFSSSCSHTSFGGNSTVIFINNSANVGAAILSYLNSSVVFKDTSEVMFSSNVAQYCGILTSAVFSTIVFNDNTRVIFNYNTMSCTSISNHESSAGAICTLQRTNVLFSGRSLVTFINNTAEQGGAVVFSNGNVSIEEYSTVTFNSNIAEYSNGGAFVCFNNSIVTFRGNSNVIFSNNKASQSGGAIHSYNMCKITFKDNSTSSFIKNTARDNGGALLSSQLSDITFEGNSIIMFDGNIADNGGTLYLGNSTITFKDTSMTSFYDNKARQKGGVGYFSLNSKGIFEGNTVIKFDNNIAEQSGGTLYSMNSNMLFKGNSVLILTHNKASSNGGALYFDYKSDTLFSQLTNITFDSNSALYGGAVSANDHSNITVTGNSVLSFVNNEASQSGGAGYCSYYCNVIIEEDAMVTFHNNKALQGGAVCFNNETKFLSKDNSTAFFHRNLATVGGGAAAVFSNSTFILRDNISINFSNNHAQYGGTVFLDASAVMINSSNRNSINFTNNNARIVGNTIYQDVADLCNESCPTDRVVGINTESIATQPYELKFYDPAVCVDDNDNDTQCNSYYVQNIMLGSDIIIPACVFDYYNNFVESIQFLVQGEFNPNYSISGPQQVLIGCSAFEGISILGNQVTKSTNLSVSVNLNVDHNSDWKQISTTLIVELSRCHPGFWQSFESQKCECYNADDIVFCSDSTSTIKRGYWFGDVKGTATVTFCPINYCNFTCCETSNGYYHLSPVRNDQCRSHRSGTACGSCTDGYTLSFDSTECVSVGECTVGQKLLVILLTVTYWIVMVILVFAVMYYKVGIGYLYCITYYYSIVDIILSQNLQASRGLYLTVNIMSSFSKVIPQFLGKLCLTTGMSGIDQQFIHYIHPSAVVLLIAIISLSARKSPKFAAFISRRIIHVICLLLLLSYTSITSTSLLLMRSLEFHEIDQVYTYLSPDIEYFHGRHLAYGIVALLCSISIVAGLPLLLTLQPILNNKFNFIKIKPLLDQFQGCYKDKYRCFAGYYMICRLMIISIVIANSSNELMASYALIVACGIIALIHVTVKPYSSEILNKFDGIVLHLIIFLVTLPLFDDFDSPMAIIVAFVLVALPLILVVTLTLFLHKDDIRKLITCFSSKCRMPNKNDDADINDDVPMKEFDHIIDDGVRQNTTVTICDM